MKYCLANSDINKSKICNFLTKKLNMSSKHGKNSSNSSKTQVNLEQKTLKILSQKTTCKGGSMPQCASTLCRQKGWVRRLGRWKNEITHGVFMTSIKTRTLDRVCYEILFVFYQSTQHM